MIKSGASVKAYDPAAMHNAKALLPQVKYCSDAYSVAKDADALVVVTEWNQFRNLDFEKIKSLMKGNFLFDLRNIYEPSKMKDLGFKYYGVGRS